ncbi:MAG: hypothetical protein JW864_06855 [Spirochaetes bacterium]|nr:hypothetical protein [Spirochaetota bacterium]
MSSILRLVITFIFLSIAALQLHAQQVITGNAPTVTITAIPGYTGDLSTFNTALQVLIDNAWDNILTDANAELANMQEPKDLAKGFSNANAYASRAATMQGYQDYSYFALMSGAMFAIQAPGFDISRSQVERIREDIKEDGDMYLGVSAGLAFVNAGINAGFIYPGLYINFKYGSYSFDGKDIDSNLEGFTYKTVLYGIGINQIILWPKRLIPGMLRWRGISIGTGFYYCKTSIGIEILEDLISTGVTTSEVTGYDPDEDEDDDPITGALALDPSFMIDIDMTTMTIPLDLTTAFRILSIINFNIGGGVDFCFGSTDIKLKSRSDVIFETGDENVIAEVEPGNIQMSGGVEDGKPSFLNPRVTAGIGFNISILKIDIPVAVYLDAGVSVGLTAGIIW